MEKTNEKKYFVKPIGEENNLKLGNFLIDMGVSPEGLSSVKKKINSAEEPVWEYTEGQLEQLRASKNMYRGVDYEIYIDIKNGVGLQKFPTTRHALTKGKLTGKEKSERFNQLKKEFGKSPRLNAI
jgi:hypothetical protein